MEFAFAPDAPSDDDYRPESTTINEALRNVPQSAFGGNLNGFQFAGTNVILETGRIILIKDDAQAQWTEQAAAKDIQGVLSPRNRSR